MKDPANDVDELLAWLQRTLWATPFGTVGFVLTKRAGRIVLVEKIYRETIKAAPTDENTPTVTAKRIK